MSTEDHESLIRDLTVASNELRKSLGGKAGEGVEKKYGVAYQQCVKAGIKPPLRKKYRGGV